MNIDAFDDLVSTIHTSAWRGRGWENVLSRLMTTFDASAAAIWEVNRVRGEVVSVGIGYAEKDLSAYKSGHWRWDPMVRQHLGDAEGEEPGAIRVADEEWERVRKDYAPQHGLVGIARHVGATGIFLSASKSADGPGFAPSEEAAFNRILHHLGSALEASGASLLDSSTGAATAEIELAIEAVLVDAHHMVMTDGAERLLGELGLALKLTNRGIELIGHGSAGAQLAAQLRPALAGGGTGRSRTHSVEVDGRAMTLSTLALDAGAGQRQGALIVMTRQAGGWAASQLDGALTRFDLTPAERRVVFSLAQGRKTGEIAHASGVSRETVRFHLKNAYAKTGARTQAELVSLLSGLIAIRH